MSLSSIMEKRPRYVYTKLKDLAKCRTNDKVNIYALVVELKKTRSVDISDNFQLACDLYLQESSADSFTRCIIYSDERERFLEIIRPGQVIRLHCIRVRVIPGHHPLLYGKLNAGGLSVVLFSGESGSSNFNVDYQSLVDHSVYADCKEIIALLRCYTDNISRAASFMHTLARESNRTLIFSCLNELVRCRYYNVVVQVISVLIGDFGSVILRCWDTTMPPNSIFFLADNSVSEVVCTNAELNVLACGYRCDIILYDEYGDYLKKNVKPLDVLLLVNLHYYVSSNGSALVMHEGGMRYKRGITILSDTSYEKTKLLKDVKAFVVKKSLLVEGLSDPRNEMEVTSTGDEAKFVRASLPASGFPAEANIVDKETHISAKLRQRQIHAVQLGWIALYLVKKWFLKKYHQSSSLTLQRSQVLAIRGAKFLIRRLFSRLKEENKDVFSYFVKLPYSEKKCLLKRFLLKYVKGTYENVIPHVVTGEHLVTDQLKADQKRKRSPEEQQASEEGTFWKFTKCIIPGTSLKLSSWFVKLKCNLTAPVFALICDKCGLWRTTSPKNYFIYILCPICFKKDQKCVKLFLKCYFPLTNADVEQLPNGKIVFFLFPVPLLSFFLIEVPENAVSAAQRWINGFTIEEQRTISSSIQDRMLSKYSFHFTELIIRRVTDQCAVFEVEKVTFRDQQ